MLLLYSISDANHGDLRGRLHAHVLTSRRLQACELSLGARVNGAFTRALDPAASPAPDSPDGHFLVVAFGYTYCPDICPTTLLAVHHALERLGAGAARVIPIFVTVDPARDTAEHLRAYLANFDPRIRGVSDPAAVAAAVRAFRARAEKRIMPGGDYSMDHTAVVYVLDPERRVIAVLPEISPTLSADIADAVAGSPRFAAAAPAP
jgi:protein SCO1/2